jgi:hypothetical protein
MDENVESLANLVDNLQEYGYDINELPMVLQYNKRDLPNILSVEEMNNRLNTHDMPTYEASATTGAGVFDTLKLIIKIVLEKAKSTAVTNKPSGGFTSAPTPPSPPPQSDPEQELPMTQSHVAETDFSQSSGISRQSSQGIATQTAKPQTEKAPERMSSYRPYPGGSGAIKTVGSGGGTPKPMNSPAPNSPAQATSQPVSNNENTPAQSSGITPTMAPSLKRRGGSKKRGIFKRLFGIK